MLHDDAGFVPRGDGWALRGWETTLALIRILEAFWYLVVAFALSTSKPRDAYLKTKPTIDRTVGVVLGILGVKLLLSSRQPTRLCPTPHTALAQSIYGGPQPDGTASAAMQ